ncbi:hypothetical protein [Sphingobacterium pedocola]|uniref:Gliding motility-associated protein GldM C-terminal domain-containing protein n=1 Tax=Sphingobacterium pedocola TaxID=2082722 RepID=A0ABR9T5Q9_9SPHI|nr:hypothetical protein [Sphingobacterium pedocola]MBE8720677.1 hypothetical protein [Sphingobacterium pedocola]
MKSLLKYILTCTFVLMVYLVTAQQKLGDGTVSATYRVNPAALLELESSARGLLHVRVALTSTTLAAPLSTHVAGMMVYNTAQQNDVVPGIYYNDGTRWVLARGGEQLDIRYDATTYQLTIIRAGGQTEVIDFLAIFRSLALKEVVTELRKKGGGRFTYFNEGQYLPDGSLRPDAVGVDIDIPGEVIQEFETVLNDNGVQNLLLQFIQNQIGHVQFDGEQFIYVDVNGVKQYLKVVDMVRDNQLLTHVQGTGPVRVTSAVNATNMRQTDYIVDVDFSQLNPILTTASHVPNLREAFTEQGMDISYAAEISVVVNTQGGRVEITLPEAGANRGRKVTIKKFDASGNLVTVKATAGERVEGLSQISGFTPYQGWVFQSNGTEWVIISRI